MLWNVTSLGYGHKKWKYSHTELTNVNMFCHMAKTYKKNPGLMDKKQHSKKFPNVCLVIFFFWLLD